MKKHIRNFVQLFIILCVCAMTAFAQNQNQAPSQAMQDANALMQAQKWTEAAKAYEAITKNEPTNGRAWFFLGLSLHSLGKYEQAIQAFEKNLAITNNPRSMYNIACGYSRLKQNDKAFEWLEKSVTNGFAQFIDLEGDSDLENIRSDIRFKKMRDIVERQVKPCMYMSEARQFDFWLGDWDVFNTLGQKVGTNSIQQIAEGCGLLENWTSTLKNNGKSINYFDPNTGKWYQFWIGSSGGALRYEGSFKDGAIRFQGETIVNNKKTINRLTFSKLDENTVRQFAEISNDDGKTWTVSYDFKYVKRK